MDAPDLVLPAAHTSVLARAEAIAEQRYGMAAVASALPGERDHNIWLHVSGGPDAVLKMSHASEREELLLAEAALLEQVAPSGLCPRLIRTTDGAYSLGTANNWCA